MQSDFIIISFLTIGVVFGGLAVWSRRKMLAERSKTDLLD
jgi:hypothetical protein